MVEGPSPAPHAPASPSPAPPNPLPPPTGLIPSTWKAGLAVVLILLALALGWLAIWGTPKEIDALNAGADILIALAALFAIYVSRLDTRGAGSGPPPAGVLMAPKEGPALPPMPAVLPAPIAAGEGDPAPGDGSGPPAKGASDRIVDKPAGAGQNPGR